MRYRKFKPLRASLKRVLVAQIDHHLGNTVLSLPVIQALANHFDHGIDLLIDERYLCFAQQLDNVNRVIPFPSQRDAFGNSRGPVQQTVKLVLKLLSHRYQANIDLCGGIRSAPIMLLTCAPRRFGFSPSRRDRCYSHVITPPAPGEPGVHEFDRYSAMLRCIGQAENPPLVRFTANDAQRAKLAERLGEWWPDLDASGAPLVVMHPSAGIAWRRWPAERFAAVADGLVAQRGARVVIIGTAGDQELVDEIMGHMSHADQARFGKLPLDLLVPLFERTAVLVSNESGPTHVAASVGTPIVTIFGPTSEKLWRPQSVEPTRLTVLRGDTCDPGCHGRSCVADQKCLLSLTADQVLQACSHTIGQDTPAPSAVSV